MTGFIPSDLTNAFTMPVVPLVEGFAIGLSLIMAIGAQGLFVLRQGLANEHLLAVCLLCSFSDLTLIITGIMGFAFFDDVPLLTEILTFGGVVFLLWYGYDRIRKGATPPEITSIKASHRPLRTTIVACLALTWLNPHVYFDTVFLIGGLAHRHMATDRIAFGVGACLASVAFFFALGYGARLLGPMFCRPRAWRVVETGSGLVMWTLAISLASTTFGP